MTITTLPVAGTLTLYGVGVIAGQSVSAAATSPPATWSFTPAANANGAGYASFTFQVQDDGGTARGVDLDPTPNTMTIDVTAVNDAPVNTVPAAQVVNEDTPLVFSIANGNAIAVADVDAATLRVTLAATNGTLTLASLAGLAFTAGDGTADATMTFTGTAAAINAALNGLSFLGTLNYNGPATVAITTEDLGQTGAGGPLQDADVVNITVNAVNDAPVIGQRLRRERRHDGGDRHRQPQRDRRRRRRDEPGVHRRGGDERPLRARLGAGRGDHELHAGADPRGRGALRTRRLERRAGHHRLRHRRRHQRRAVHDERRVHRQRLDHAPAVRRQRQRRLDAGSPSSRRRPRRRISRAVRRIPARRRSCARRRARPTTAATTPRRAEVGTPVTRFPTGRSQDKVGVPVMGMPTVRAESETIDTKPLRSEIEVAPIRAEMQVLPVRQETFDNPDDEERRDIEVILSSVRITGLAFSVGAVWWAARAAGLMASLLASSPAWRHVDPLPVLGRDDEEEEVWDETAEEEDQDRKDDEHRAAWVLEEREAGS